MLTYRPIVPGSDHHLRLMSKAQRLGRVLYPALYERRDAEHHRRASQAIAAAAARVHTKQDPASASTKTGSTIYTDLRSGSGCSTECA